VSFTDTVNKAIGNAHCGWRGTFSELSKKTLLAMQKEYGTNAKDVVVAIGPCICKNCYEVSKDLYLDFKEKFHYENCIVKENDKFFLDLGGINKNILMDAGVKEENISICDLCTCCNTSDLFSHRGQGGRRGILASVISLN
jgi:YfiH family protein